jgi:hypothetical protein
VASSTLVNDSRTDLGSFHSAVTIRMSEFEQAAREVEAEVKRAVEYIETNIVPKARRDGERVLRRLSEELSRWADRLHDDKEQNK